VRRREDAEVSNLILPRRRDEPLPVSRLKAGTQGVPRRLAVRRGSVIGTRDDGETGPGYGLPPVVRVRCHRKR
jgi:hypothetical protein